MKQVPLTLTMENVGLIYGKDTLSQMDGMLYMEGNMVGARKLGLVYNGSEA